jgi:sugar phosphate isomerase/epimerase
MKKGVQAFTVRDYFGDKETCRETIRKIAEIGYDSIQWGAPKCMTVQETVDLLKEFNITNCSGGASYDALLGGGKAITEAAETARAFGTNIISVGTLPEEYRYNQDGIKKYAASLNKIAADLKKEGCVLSYHHHALEFFSFGGGVNGMDILTGETDPDGVQFCLDTHWLTSAGVDPVYWIKKMKGRIPLIHFKDYAIIEGAVKIEDVFKMFAEVGEGNIAWPRIVEACKEVGVEYVIVEQDKCMRSPFDCLKTSFDNMVKMGV